MGGRVGELAGAAFGASRTKSVPVAVATDGFAAERAYLATLTAAAGPLPSTPGQAETDAALVAQRHAFDMLAHSDRAGCATGAAIALVIDWYAFRDAMDVAAARFGVNAPEMTLPDEIEVATSEPNRKPITRLNLITQPMMERFSGGACSTT